MTRSNTKQIVLIILVIVGAILLSRIGANGQSLVPGINVDQITKGQQPIPETVVHLRATPPKITGESQEDGTLDSSTSAVMLPRDTAKVSVSVITTNIAFRPEWVKQHNVYGEMYEVSPPPLDSKASAGNAPTYQNRVGKFRSWVMEGVFPPRIDGKRTQLVENPLQLTMTISAPDTPGRYTYVVAVAGEIRKETGALGWHPLVDKNTKYLSTTFVIQWTASCGPYEHNSHWMSKTKGFDIPDELAADIAEYRGTFLGAPKEPAPPGADKSKDPNTPPPPAPAPKRTPRGSLRDAQLASSNSGQDGAACDPQGYHRGEADGNVPIRPGKVTSDTAAFFSNLDVAFLDDHTGRKLTEYEGLVRIRVFSTCPSGQAMDRSERPAGESCPNPNTKMGIFTRDNDVFDTIESSAAGFGYSTFIYRRGTECWAKVWVSLRNPSQPWQPWSKARTYHISADGAVTRVDSGRNEIIEQREAERLTLPMFFYR